MEIRLRNVNSLLDNLITNEAKNKKISKNEIMLEILEKYFLEKNLKDTNEIVVNKLEEYTKALNKNINIMNELIDITNELIEISIEKELRELKKQSQEENTIEKQII